MAIEDVYQKQHTRWLEIEKNNLHLTEDDYRLFGSTIHFCEEWDYLLIFDKMDEYKLCMCPGYGDKNDIL